MPIGGFFVLTIAGIVAGFVFGIGKAIKELLKNKIYFVIVIDFFVAIALGAIFTFAEYKYLDFQIFGFGIFSFLIGFFAERISLGFLVAKSFSFIYNMFVKGLNRLKTSRLGKKMLK